MSAEIIKTGVPIEEVNTYWAQGRHKMSADFMKKEYSSRCRALLDGKGLAPAVSKPLAVGETDPRCPVIVYFLPVDAAEEAATGYVCEKHQSLATKAAPVVTAPFKVEMVKDDEE